jgi:hypothetical protein
LTRNYNGAVAFRCTIPTARRHFNALFKRRGGISTRNLNGLAAFVRAIYTAHGISTSNLNGAAAFGCAIQTVRLHFDEQFKRRGCISTRNLRHFYAQFKQRGGISTHFSNDAAAFRRVISMARRHFDAQFILRGGIPTRNLSGATALQRAI